jgi:hypothetical protein
MGHDDAFVVVERIIPDLGVRMRHWWLVVAFGREKLQ